MDVRILQSDPELRALWNHFELEVSLVDGLERIADASFDCGPEPCDDRSGLRIDGTVEDARRTRSAAPAYAARSFSAKLYAATGVAEALSSNSALFDTPTAPSVAASRSRPAERGSSTSSPQPVATSANTTAIRRPGEHAGRTSAPNFEDACIETLSLPFGVAPGRGGPHVGRTTVRVVSGAGNSVRGCQHFLSRDAVRARS